MTGDSLGNTLFINAEELFLRTLLLCSSELECTLSRLESVWEQHRDCNRSYSSRHRSNGWDYFNSFFITNVSYYTKTTLSTGVLNNAVTSKVNKYAYQKYYKQSSDFYDITFLTALFVTALPNRAYICLLYIHVHRSRSIIK